LFFVRQSQIDAFARAAVDDFVARMVARLERFFPDQSRDLGAAGLEARVREGVDRAARRGIEREYHVCLYLDVMMELGPRFDEDPSLPWARALLEDPALGPATGVDVLHTRVFAPEIEPMPEHEKH
jgi:hypothetical protein